MSETVPDMFPRNQIKIPQFDKYLKSIIEPSLSKGLQRAFEIRTSMDELTVMTFITGLTTDLATNTRNDVRSLCKIDFLNDELGYHYYFVFDLCASVLLKVFCGLRIGFIEIDPCISKYFFIC